LQQMILKIIANSTSYGIFIEINTEHKEEVAEVYGLDKFKASVARSELEGKAFNPIIATFVTSAARLILAAAEAILASHGDTILYCDTDSILISPDKVPLIQTFFQNLNPYATDGVQMFKVEKSKPLSGKKHNLDSVWFCGISSKRYVLYKRDQSSRIAILKYSSHGIGHLIGVNEEQWWHNILGLHYSPELRRRVEANYRDQYVTSTLSITSYSTYRRFAAYNARKSFQKQIKPFNFVTVGTSYRLDDAGRPIVPMLPYTPQAIDGVPNPEFLDLPFRPFLDYKTGKHYQDDTEFYWLPLSEMFDDYRTHPEAKFEGETGIMRRRRLSFNGFSISYIGKESNDLEAVEAISADIEDYTYYTSPRNMVKKNKSLLNLLGAKDAAKYGIMRSVWKNVLAHASKDSLDRLPRRTLLRVAKLLQAHIEGKLRSPDGVAV
jgi:hypothetical protein